MTLPNNGVQEQPATPQLGETPPEFRDAARPQPQPNPARTPSWELRKYMAEVKGQAQFLLYLADQIEESLDQLTAEADPCHSAFLCRVLSMYSSQLEAKHQGLGEKIAEACQEVYVTVREREP